MRSLFFPARRASEATANQLAASGAGGGWGYDPVDGDIGYRPVGSAGTQAGRPVPVWTLEKQRAYSVAAYRIHPMARAIIDTYTSFCVGDSGLTMQCASPIVKPIADRFWNDPRNAVVKRDEFLRDKLLMGEQAIEPMVGLMSGVTRLSIIDPTRVASVQLLAGNPLWHDSLTIGTPGFDSVDKKIVQIDDLSGRRAGEVMWWPCFRALLTDRRGSPFLSPVLDWLDSYDLLLSNLIDRTSLLRYLVWDVTLDGMDQKQIDEYVKARGGQHVPPAGSVEFHNDKVHWEAKTAEVGAAEDTQTASTIMTSVSAGAGLSKTWLAEPDGANRATSLTMAEPVRRRVSSVQNLHVGHVNELLWFAVDQAVAAGVLPAMVPSVAPGVAEGDLVPAWSTVSVTGPEVAAADAQVTAEMFVNLAQSLPVTVVGRLLSPEAARIAIAKAWEQFVGRPLSADIDILDSPDADILAEILAKSDAPAVSLKLA